MENGVAAEIPLTDQQSVDAFMELTMEATAVMSSSFDPVQRMREILAQCPAAPLSEWKLCSHLRDLPDAVWAELITAFNYAAVGIDLLMISPDITPEDSAVLYDRMRRYERTVLLLDPDERYEEAPPMFVNHLLAALHSLPREARVELAETYADAAIGFYEFFTTLRTRSDAPEERVRGLRFEEIRGALLSGPGH